MDRPQAFFEISSDSIKLIVGYELNGSPIVLYTKEVKVPNLLDENKAINKEALNEAFASFHNIKDEKEKLNIAITRINLVLPSVGLQVYQNDKTTNVVDQNNEITKLDITNVISLVSKESVPGDYSIVDIIPDEFIIDSGERFSNPPLGKKSTSLTIKAKVHCLPSGVDSFYHNCANSCGYRLLKRCVSCYCASTLLATYPELPRSYVLIDMGSRLTSVSLVGDASPYENASFYLGGYDLDKKIAREFGVDLATASKLKKRLGYDDRKTSYSFGVAEGLDASSNKVTYYQKDLNQVISSYFEEYFKTLENALNSIFSKYGNKFDNLPFILIGGASKLNGLSSLFASNFPNRNIYFVTPKTIGARDPSYVNLLGLVLASSHYGGTLEDNYRGMAEVSRVSKQVEKKKKGKSSSPEDDSL